jgi:hypothetical protein
MVEGLRAGLELRARTARLSTEANKYKLFK